MSAVLVGAAAGLAVERPALRSVAAPVAGATRSVREQATEARVLEEAGAYARAAAVLRALRARVPADADLELALALDEARSGALDSAAARLAGPLLTAAGSDSLPVQRRHEYPWQREPAWINGRFDGWHWYVWRARAEVAAARGDWTAARDAARHAAAARPMSGKEWAILSLCAAHAGDERTAREAARQAATLDPTLPEALYLSAWWGWKDGRRLEAQAGFRRAAALDTAWSAPALALVRSRLPGAAPEGLPTELLHGARRAALLASSEGPKIEEFVQMDESARILKQVNPFPGETPGADGKPVRLSVSLLVDERGRVVTHDLPWFGPEQLSYTRVAAVLATLPEWEFLPARRLGEPRRVWAAVEFVFPSPS